MNIELLTPWGALLVLVVLVPLAAFLAVSKRAAGMRRVLGVSELPRATHVVPLVAILVIGGLLGLAATQPLVARASTRDVRTDAQVFLVLDISRSMLARRGLDGAMRIDRAKEAAVELRETLPDVPVGIASLTNRVLPHLFPSADEDVFRATLDKAVGIERPAPGTGFIVAPGQVGSRNATSLSALAGLGTEGFFPPGIQHKLVVVLTDGESSDNADTKVGQTFRRAGIDAIFLQFWGARERVFTNGEAEPQYRPQPGARAVLESLAAATGGAVFSGRDLRGAERQAHADLGEGDTRVEAAGHSRKVPLAPYLAAVAFLPLGILLWRRDR